MIRRTFTASALALTLGASSFGTAAIAQETSFSMASLGDSSPTTAFSIAVTQILKDEYDYSVQLSTGTPATRQAVESANDQLDLFVTAVVINHLMRNNLAMFSEMEDAPELNGKLRSILNYPFGAYHAIVWADSGIESLEDIAGKRVFIGPPSGAARNTISQIIAGVSGLEPDVDFEAVSVDWSSAEQAFQDRQIDVYFTSAPFPSAQLQQLSALGDFRVLGVPEDKMESEGIMAALGVPGRTLTVLEPGSYSGLVNEEPVQLVNSVVGLGTNIYMSEEDAYNITKAIFENGDALIGAAAWMDVITPERALDAMNLPLHIGAYRYYQEVGIDVPEELIPPEAN